MSENKPLIKQSFNLSRDYKKRLLKCGVLKSWKEKQDKPSSETLGWTYLSRGEMYIMTKFVLI